MVGRRFTQSCSGYGLRSWGGTTREELRRVANETFGWSLLRDEQLEAMEQVMAGHDVLAVLPTGAGKSAIYQVPAVLLRGPTVVVSPLIALQQDQVDGIEDSRLPTRSR